MLAKLLPATCYSTFLKIPYCRKFSTDIGSHRLWRSFFYVPGDQEKKISKIATLCNTLKYTPTIPDIIVLDCEDAVSVGNKVEARMIISSALTSGGGRSFSLYRNKLHRGVSLRINPPSTGLAEADLDYVIPRCIEVSKRNSVDWPGPDYITVPKTESAEDLHFVESKLLEIFNANSYPLPKISFVGMVESPKSLMHMSDLCKSISTLKFPLVALVFGSDDYCASLGVTHSVGHEETLFARQYFLTMCAAHNLASIDMVDTDLNNDERFIRNCTFGSQIGFSGKQLIHPKQIELANTAFSPSPERVAWATALVKAASETSQSEALESGAFTFQGHMIDRPTIRQAECLVRAAQLANPD